MKRLLSILAVFGVSAVGTTSKLKVTIYQELKQLQHLQL